ncbi:MAG: ABC transporter permease, partial [Planctomycetes bacterium]|nr:ABC transporter permease [Planctomycetota bacterium]
SDKADPDDPTANVWFIGEVAIGEVFEIDAKTEGESRLKANTYVSILGTTASYAKIHDYKAAEGRFITPQDVRGKSMVCVLGHTVAADLFGALPAVHERVKLNGKTFMVVGVMEERGAIGMIDADKQVIMPLTTAMRRMFGARHLTVLTVQCADAGSLPLCIERVQKTLRVAHRIRAGAEDDFSIITQEVMKRFVAGITKISAIVLYSIAGISTVVGAIGIMNIMLVSVTERTREIGVRMAVGARRFDILRQFLTEATVISVLGGALGILFGVAMANLIVTFSGDIFQVHTRLSLIVGALTMAAVVGIISGIYPAIRAARLDPVQALRYE